MISKAVLRMVDPLQAGKGRFGHRLCWHEEDGNLRSKSRREHYDDRLADSGCTLEKKKRVHAKYAV